MINIYGTIRRVNIFRYLREVIQREGLEEEANNVRIRKLDLAYRLPKNIYNKKLMGTGVRLTR